MGLEQQLDEVKEQFLRIAPAERHWDYRKRLEPAAVLNDLRSPRPS